MWSAYRVGTRFDRLAALGTFAVISIPTFLFALLLVLFFAINLHVFPLGLWARPSDRGWLTNLRYAFLPALALAVPEGAIYSRVLRSDMISTLQEDYILAARAKGMPTWHILAREALRPSSFSLITLIGLSVGRLLGGTIIVEQVFSLPGLGSVIVNAVNEHDYPLVQGGILLIAVVYVLVNLLVDVLYTYLDPRIRRQRV
jgi:peptide/nickel transport system permease protein